MESFLVAVNAVVPFLCYITFGYVMKIKGVVKEDFLQQLNKMVFKVFYPFMTFYNIYKADASSLPRPVMLIFCGISILVLEVILVLTVPRLVKENPRRGVIIQAIYRSNFVLFGLPLTVSVFGDVASSVAAMVAGGAQVIVFSSGRGSPVGHPIAPVVKVTGNKITFANMEDNIDFCAAPLIYGEKTVEQLGTDLLNMVVETACGKQTKAEALGFVETAIARICNYV